jgi:SAM-dependent methyltransferase
MASTATTPSSCNVCDAPLRMRFETVLDPQSRETFSIVECRECGLGHTSPQPSDLGPYYGAGYHGGRHGFTARYCISRRLGFLASQPGSSNKRLLDIGCGDGSFLAAAKGEGWDVFGTEMNPVLARERGLTVEESVEAAKAHGPFGCITLWHSLEHFRDPAGTIAAARELLAPDGTLIIAVPDWSGVQARTFGANWFHLDVPRHLFHFTQQSLDTLAAKSGLKISKTWHTEAELDLFGWTQSALNMVLAEPNGLFSIVMGKPTTFSTGAKLMHLAGGTAATLAALPVFSAAIAAGLGGIVVIALQPSSRPQ